MVQFANSVPAAPEGIKLPFPRRLVGLGSGTVSGAKMAMIVLSWLMVMFKGLSVDEPLGTSPTQFENT